ncbi:SigB/SigF/SigG family RNA polymerase sigma factor [Mycolicibacterium moriokaense]|nr:SigB/SigF/SigG family RNA polymerase sigma factor [Mycolicibacterium moriokaense]
MTSVAADAEQPVATTGHDSEYEDVAEMFRELAAQPEDSVSRRDQRDRIIERCLPLADHIARRFARRGEAFDDLVQVARIGLVNAVKRYDVYSGHAFLSFAVPTIMGEVRRYFRDSGWAVAVPRRLKDLHQRINGATAELAQRTGRAPTATELSRHLEVDRSEVLEALMAGGNYRTASIDAARPSGDGEAPTLAESIGEIDAGLEHVENMESLRPLLAALPDRERAVIAMRFFESLTQTQIAARLDISQMQVSRLLARSLAALRDGMTTGPSVSAAQRS